MMKTYLGNGADELEGFDFLNMAEAGELAHVEDTKQATLTLAEREDPNEPA